MDIISYILGAVLLFVTIFYVGNIAKYIKNISSLRAKGETIIVEGEIIEKVEEEKKSATGGMVSLCYPKYEYEVNGKKSVVQGLIKKPNVSLGETSKIEYCERTGEAWVIEDIEPLKRKMTRTAIIILAIITVLVVTTILL